MEGYQESHQENRGKNGHQKSTKVIHLHIPEIQVEGMNWTLTMKRMGSVRKEGARIVALPGNVKG